MDETVRTRLKKLKEQYGTTQKLLEVLNKNGVPVHRTTLYRWLKENEDDKDRPESSPRSAKALAALAVQILKSNAPAETAHLRVVQPDTNRELPSKVVCLQKSLRLNEVTTGGMALDKLCSGEADLAVAASVLVLERAREHPVRCARLCTLSRAPLVAIARKDRLQRDHADTLTLEWMAAHVVGYPDTSAVPELLNRLGEKEQLEFRRRQKLPSKWNEVAQALCPREGRPAAVDVFVAWEAGIRKVKKILQAENISTVELSGGPLGYLLQDIAVNLETAPPAAVWTYLLCVQDACNDLKNPGKRGILLKQLNLKLPRETFTNTSFDVRDLNLKVLADLRSREIDMIRAKPDFLPVPVGTPSAS